MILETERLYLREFKNASGVLAAAWSNAPTGQIPQHSSTDHACDPPEALSWKEIGLPPRRNCRNSPPKEVGVSSSFKMNQTDFDSLCNPGLTAFRSNMER